MTEPTEPTPPTESTAPTAPTAHAESTAPTAPTEPAAAPAGTGPTAAAPFPQQPIAYPMPAPYPFAPVVKEPWFNPAKRTTILITSIVAAIVLLGGGVLIGLAAGHHDRRDRPGFTLYGPAGGRVIVPGNGHGPRFVVPDKQFPGNGRDNHRVQPSLAPSPSSSAATS